MHHDERSNALKEASLFFGLTLGLSFLVFWGPLALFKVPTISFVKDTTGPGWAIALFILGGFIPSLVAVLLTWRRQGSTGLRNLWRGAFNFRLGRRWYLTTLGIVVFGSAGQLAINRLLGHGFDMSLFLSQLGSIVPLIILGPLSEELGWRGYALGRLQTQWSPVTSGCIVGLGWGLWHLPLFYMVGTAQHELSMPFIGFIIGLIGVSVLMTWIYNGTGGNIWSAVFFHWIYTYSNQVVATGVTRSTSYNWLEYLPYMVAAIVAVFAMKKSRGLSRYRAMEQAE